MNPNPSLLQGGPWDWQPQWIAPLPPFLNSPRLPHQELVGKNIKAEGHHCSPRAYTPFTSGGSLSGCGRFFFLFIDVLEECYAVLLRVWIG